MKIIPCLPYTQASLHPANDHSGCSTLRRYYAQLQFLQSRFPMGEGGAVSVQFTWYIQIYKLFLLVIRMKFFLVT